MTEHKCPHCGSAAEAIPDENGLGYFGGCPKMPERQMFPPHLQKHGLSAITPARNGCWSRGPYRDTPQEALEAFCNPPALAKARDETRAVFDEAAKQIAELQGTVEHLKHLVGHHMNKSSEYKARLLGEEPGSDLSATYGPCRKCGDHVSLADSIKAAFRTFGEEHGGIRFFCECPSCGYETKRHLTREEAWTEFYEPEGEL